MVAKKLMVDDKITACVKQVSWVLYAKFRIEKRLVKHFAFLKNVCYQYLYFLLRVTQLLFFYELLIGHNQLSSNVLLLSCNPIGQHCLGGLGCSSCLVIRQIIDQAKQMSGVYLPFP